MNLTGNVQRGCGRRTAGALYICCGLSEADNALPLEQFILDPVMPWPADFQRGTKMLQRKDGIWDIVIFVGKQFYPSAWSFIEEAKRFGVSRKLACNIPVDLLTAGKSRMLFVHRSAIPMFDYKDISVTGPHLNCKHKSDSELHPGHHENGTPCAYSLKSLSYFQHAVKYAMTSAPEAFTVTMPSFEYTAALPTEFDAEKVQFATGLFLALPVTHFESKGSMNPDSKNRIAKTNFNFFELNY